jgi:hypothetical protein
VSRTRFLRAATFLRGTTFLPSAPAGSDPHDEHDDGYTGPGVFVAGDGRRFEVEVSLEGDFQPIEGRFDWHGRLRIEPDPQPASGKLDGELQTPHGVAPGRLSARDLWGRYRITGRGVPPFPLDHLQPFERLEQTH